MALAIPGYGSAVSQITCPVFVSKARSLLSNIVEPIKSSPLAVTTPDIVVPASDRMRLAPLLRLPPVKGRVCGARSLESRVFGFLTLLARFQLDTLGPVHTTENQSKIVHSRGNLDGSSRVRKRTGRFMAAK